MISKLLRKTRKKIAGEETGFTMVELLIVVIVSSIMLVGMVGLLSMAFQTFTSGKSLQSLSDASRRALPAMDRQMKSILHINDAECVASYKVSDGVWNGISFYADIDNDNNDADIENYTNAEKIEFYLDTDTNTLMQRTTEPGGGAGTPTSLCSYVDNVRFYYFLTGVAGNDDTPPSNRYQGDEPNSSAGSIKVVITLTKGKLTRIYEQSTFLRMLERD